MVLAVRSRFVILLGFGLFLAGCEQEGVCVKGNDCWHYGEPEDECKAEGGQLHPVVPAAESNGWDGGPRSVTCRKLGFDKPGGSIKNTR
ncbi:hypothetical protein SAMN02745121_01051 [Nannocystis exedens]|uniref:Lipoprotein n=1 Tax=Nannocystis exedens TaxID=54 RepID=A0A1I1U8K0_9BACT|nr:hypothetical protein [Nannocystis exedens]SFD67107.1 hypothetical protein SAMN02745121_01051 [Nannocystis exedens]